MGTMSTTERKIQLLFSRADQIQDGIDQAVQTLIESTNASGGCGILVTRHEPGAYTVALDESVPFRQVREQHKEH